MNFGDFIKTEFPSIDDDVKQYVEGVLENGIDDFQNTEDVYEAIGEVLQEISIDKTEDEIKDICTELLKLLNPGNNATSNGSVKILNAPVHLGSMAANLENNIEDIKSIWVMQRDDNLKVDAKKLEKAELKLQQKQEKRGTDGNRVPVNIKLETATASQGVKCKFLARGVNVVAQAESAGYNHDKGLQYFIYLINSMYVTSKKDSKLEAKGINKTLDIRIENFDISYGDRVLLQGADLLLSFGRRYGFVGRNGLGKTTLLRMMSNRQLHIPAHISILHVEQEVVGDDTTALNSVLQCDTVREGLLATEKTLNAAINSGCLDASLSTQLSEVYVQLQHIESDKAPARASVILDGLGFTSDMQGRATRTFSGGWRMRLALARALFSKPDLLLLDEPTNMLDIKAIIWLENYLKNWPNTLLVVSHNRNFLDAVPTDILYLHSQRIESYKGNYEQFIKTKTEKHKNQQREYEAQHQHRAHVQEFIDKFRYNANRAALVQSRIKMLEKLPILKPIEKEVGVVLKFPDVEPLSPPILQLNEVSFYYVPEKIIFNNVNLGATLESRICIVGDNGAGKTTLLKIIMGLLSPTSGMTNCHRNLKFGYFSQHHVDQLDMNVNSVELLQKEYPGRPVEEYRRQLGSFGVSGDLALQSVLSLSGGQKSRVAFSRMCMGYPNFLILDEPTNHLDIETIEALGKGINLYHGGVILVSHDERLIRMVCNELWVCGNGSINSIEGGFDEYRQIVEKELEAQSAK